MRTAMLVVGILAVLTGAIWIGQGTGVFPYPASSFMVGQPPWAYYGAGLAIVGVALIGVSRQR
jgi:hypothetical protein